MPVPSPVTLETVSAVIVSFSDPEATRRAIESVLDQTVAPLEVLVVDNDPLARLATLLPRWNLDPRVSLLHSGENVGYTAACNCAAAQARGDWVFFLNPDARADRDCVRELVVAGESGAGAVGAQVLLPDGFTNAGDNPLHVTGVGWAGRYREPREYGPPRATAAVSGAALLVRRSAYRHVRGMCERFFLYYDDVDLCWRLRLAGWEVMFCPEAVVWHDYEFEKGTGKWYWLERNRLWSLLANYSSLTLLLLLPLIAATQAAVAGYALRASWGTALLRAWGSTLRSAPELAGWRRQVQCSRRRPDSEIMNRMVGRVETQLLESSLARAAGTAMDLYRSIVLAILRLLGR
jgi:GT2 family glycosyltransferase